MLFPYNLLILVIMAKKTEIRASQLRLYLVYNRNCTKRMFEARHLVNRKECRNESCAQIRGEYLVTKVIEILKKLGAKLITVSDILSALEQLKEITQQYQPQIIEIINKVLGN